MKKRKLSAIVAACLTLALLAGLLAATTLADSNIPTVTYNHNTQQFEFRNVSTDNDNLETGYPNLFQKMTDLVPGDTISQDIIVNTEGLSNLAWIDLSLKAEASSKGADAQAAYDTLMAEDNVTMTVKNSKDGSTVSSGKLSEGVNLGTLYRNDELKLTVTLAIPVEAGNELQGLAAGIDWIFTVGYHSGSSGGGGGTIIEDEETPLGPLPELEKGDHFAYIVGRDDGLVHPEANITRAEVATIFFRLLTEESRNLYWGSTSTYPDVADDAWYMHAVATLSNAGILHGRPDGTFDPNAPITRAEFAAVASRFFGGEYEGPDLFSDISGSWARGAINQAAVLGIINGFPDGTFRPDRNITRAEAVAMINRTLDRRPHQDYLLDDMITWPDNADTSVWYYADVQEATNSHYYEPSEERDENGNQYEIWTTLREVRDWAALEQQWVELNQVDNPGNVMYYNSRDNYTVK